MSDGFLSRWSRRKRDEARRPVEVPEAPATDVAAELAEEGSLTPEELAALPSLDTLTAATDLAPFLRAGVPRVLRNAALRRMWSVDPAIRDFVSEAREYAYDWNTPGGVPGTGGLIPAEEVRAMVERVFGGAEKPSTPAVSDDSGEVARSPSPRGRGEGSADLAVGGASGEPGVRREGEGVAPDEAPSETPPHPRSGYASAHVIPDEGDDVLSRPAGRGDTPALPFARTVLSPLGDATAPDRRGPDPETPPDPAAPPRLRRHGGASPI
ncbi:Protein of unknown function [Methylobacterium sp. ap11]|uniref:DUF3306 domain-containing protein n=1 Tax=Methylobacterium sp. ap11 TaxID=1761799 RepID=UPI0008D0665B|nr:DUF3306 domain-containing protein [Methylobacterium sp. ap11]SEO82481.1 Protein of unknown function [Methylobacterium sp. ap11]